MEVTIGSDGLTKTWQREFPEEVSCIHCKGISRVGFVASEALSGVLTTEEERVCSLHENKGKGGYWLHDCCAVAVYFCKECLQPTALSNQA
ncbi:hypothetical protein KAR91_34625 [Candidatus Pacearchaeota archaeon]|nr:hypothetical protein [Candidatus Pacearchaeota archaeon]